MDGGFEKHIWLLPLGELAGVLQQLYVSREQCKQVIYEITGISDILRGQSKASETLGAQKVKEAWGTMRLKNMQSDVQEYVRDVLRIMLDVAVKNLPQKMWIDVTGLPYPTKEKKEKGLKLINKLKPMIQQAVIESQQNPQENKQLKKLQEEASELTEMLAQPSWEDILAVLKDDYIRSFKVDIETNSTLDVEATEDKKNIAEAMNAMAQFMNGLMPMVENGVLPFSAAKSMLLDITKRFRFGPEVEDEINAMTEPQGPNKEQAQEEQKKLAEEKKKLQQEQQKFQEEQKKVGDKIDQQVFDLEKKELRFEFKKKLFEEQQKMEKQLALEEIKNMDKQMSNDLDAKQSKAEVRLQKQLDKTERAIQGMMDKHTANLSKSMETTQSKAPAINIENVMPDSDKSITINREDGQIVGADVAATT